MRIHEKILIDEAAIMLGDMVETENHLDYAITLLLHRYVRKHGLSQRTITDIEGALSHIEHEFHRRIVGPYHDGEVTSLNINKIIEQHRTQLRDIL